MDYATTEMMDAAIYSRVWEAVAEHYNNQAIEALEEEREEEE